MLGPAGRPASNKESHMPHKPSFSSLASPPPSSLFFTLEEILPVEIWSCGPFSLCFTDADVPPLLFFRGPCLGSLQIDFCTFFFFLTLLLLCLHVIKRPPLADPFFLLSLFHIFPACGTSKMASDSRGCLESVRLCFFAPCDDDGDELEPPSECCYPLPPDPSIQPKHTLLVCVSTKVFNFSFWMHRQSVFPDKRYILLYTDPQV